MSFKKFKTEKMLLASIGILTLFLFASAFSKEIVGTNVSSAEEGSGTSNANDNEDSQDDEKSQEEESQDDEKSEPSVSSAPSVRTTQGTATNADELSEKSSDEASEQSVETEETSEVSEQSEVSQEISEESIKYVEGYGEVVSKDGNVAIVKKDEKFTQESILFAIYFCKYS